MTAADRRGHIGDKAAAKEAGRRQGGDSLGNGSPLVSEDQLFWQWMRGAAASSQSSPLTDTAPDAVTDTEPEAADIREASTARLCITTREGRQLSRVAII